MPQQLTIRCAVHQTDYEHTIDAKCTIIELKRHLHTNHTGNPPVAAQRIIFMGRVLQDNELVSTALSRAGGDYGNSPILHLMYTTPQAATTSVPRPHNVKPTPVQTTPPPVAASSAQPPMTSGGVGNETTQQMHAAYANYIAQYQQAMMAQYSAYWSQLGGHHPMMMMDMMQHQQQNMWQAGNYATAPPILPAHAAAPAAAEVPPPVLPAAADEHAADDGDDAIARDFLDYAYLALRASMLLIVLYYYSSSVRIFGVLVAAFVMWMMQRAAGNGNGGVHPVAQAGVPGNNQEVNNNNNVQNVLAPNAEPQQNDQANVDNQSPPPVANVTPVAEPSALNVFCATCTAFIGGFFLSLVPDHGLANQHQPAEPQPPQAAPMVA